jgi:hypothetical protein
VPGYSH